jgi:addiction module RelE/StbE family toxin
MTVVWSRLARRHLFAAYEYIAADNDKAAFRLVEHIEQAVGRLAEFPHLGRASRLIGRRELVVDAYVITYRVRRDEIRIVSLAHGAQRK